MHTTFLVEIKYTAVIRDGAELKLKPFVTWHGKAVGEYQAR